MEDIVDMPLNVKKFLSLDNNIDIHEKFAYLIKSLDGDGHYL